MPFDRHSRETCFQRTCLRRHLAIGVLNDPQGSPCRGAHTQVRVTFREPIQPAPLHVGSSMLLKVKCLKDREVVEVKEERKTLPLPNFTGASRSHGRLSNASPNSAIHALIGVFVQWMDA